VLSGCAKKEYADAAVPVAGRLSFYPNAAIVIRFWSPKAMGNAP
jgi:hypothetical protein